MVGLFAKTSCYADISWALFSHIQAQGLETVHDQQKNLNDNH